MKTMVSIEVPLGQSPDPDEYAGRHVDMQLTGQQPVLVKQLLDGMFGKELKTGRKVVTSADALRYLIDLLIDARDAEATEPQSHETKEKETAK